MCRTISGLTLTIFILVCRNPDLELAVRKGEHIWAQTIHAACLIGQAAMVFWFLAVANGLKVWTSFRAWETSFQRGCKPGDTNRSPLAYLESEGFNPRQRCIN